MTKEDFAYKLFCVCVRVCVWECCGDDGGFDRPEEFK